MKGWTNDNTYYAWILYSNIECYYTILNRYMISVEYSFDDGVNELKKMESTFRREDINWNEIKQSIYDNC